MKKPALILIVSVLFVSGCSSTQYPRPVAPYWSRVMKTGSMFPTLRGGETVLISPIREDQVRSGLVLSYRRGDVANIMHRVSRVVVRNGVTYLYMKGDWNTFEDAPKYPITFDQVTGCWIDGRDPRTWPTSSIAAK